jgi:hypothetical protein
MARTAHITYIPVPGADHEYTARKFMALVRKSGLIAEVRTRAEFTPRPLARRLKAKKHRTRLLRAFTREGERRSQLLAEARAFPRERG